MYVYPTFTDSYAQNRRALLDLFGLTDPSQAPFTQIPCLITETSSRNLSCYTLTPGNKDAESDWVCLALSVVALRRWGKWPTQPNYSGGFNDWQFEIDEEDIDFLSQFFAEAWETLQKQHPSICNLIECKSLYFKNCFDMVIEDGRARLITWLRWIVEALWKNRDSDCSTETDADVRALQLIVDLLGEGTLRIIEDRNQTLGVRTWILQAIHLIKGTIVFPAPKFDKWIAEHFQARGLQVGFHTYIHPGAYVGKRVTIGHGVIVEAGAFIEDGASIGDQSYIGVGTYVGPNARIGINVKLLSPELGERPVIIGNQVRIEAGVIIFPDTQAIPGGTTLQSGVILRPTTFIYDQNGLVIVTLPSDTSISPLNTDLLMTDTSH